MLGSGVSGLLEIGIFHPFDTISKRLMRSAARFPAFLAGEGHPRPVPHACALLSCFRCSNHKKLIVAGAPASENMNNVMSVILKDAHNNPSVFKKWMSLFPGLGFATLYKVQRLWT